MTDTAGETTEALATGGGANTAGGAQWRCVQCTFLNEEFASTCVMCNDDDSSTGGGGNTSDDLANFLGGSGFLDGNHFNADSRNSSFHRGNSAGAGATVGGSQQQYALQSADAKELECLAEHISGGSSLPKQAHTNIDTFWGTMDTFPRILMLFRTIVQSPTSHRFLEPIDENELYMVGLPAYSSVVRNPLCFHAIVSALSRSEDALKYPHLTMRLSNGKLPNNSHDDDDDDDGIGGLQNLNMWNGLHLIKAIDLVLLNSIAYNEEHNLHGSQNSQLRMETESLWNLLWEGVNGMLIERLQPHERRQHLPQRRNESSSFVVVNQSGGSRGSSRMVQSTLTMDS